MKVEQYLKSIRKMSSRVIISLKHRPEGLQLNGAHTPHHRPDPCRGHPSVTMEDTPPDYLERDPGCRLLQRGRRRRSTISGLPCHQAKTHRQDTWRMSLPGTAGSGDSPELPVHQPPGPEHSGAVVAKNAHAAYGAGRRGPGGIQVHKRYTACHGILPSQGHHPCRYCPHRRGDDHRMADNAAGAGPGLRRRAMGPGTRLRSSRSTQGAPIRSGYICGGWATPAGDDTYGWDFRSAMRRTAGRIWSPHPVTADRVFCLRRRKIFEAIAVGVARPIGDSREKVIGEKFCLG